jgi:glycosyltransferase involved in cell wall biosynthesis
VRISVVIPAKDDAAMLDRCLRALADQVRPADEIIVVDNGSVDATAGVARSHGVQLITERRPGITAAASAGYDEADGDVIARCDADSICPPDWLARIERTFLKREDAIAVTGRGRFYDLSLVGRMLADILYMRAYFVAAGAALANVPLFGSNFAIRASVWRSLSESVPRNNEDLHDDFDLSYRLDPAAVIVYDRDLVVGISGRPFRDLKAMRERFVRAAVTMREHRTQRPLQRWRRRFEGAPAR